MKIGMVVWAITFSKGGLERLGAEIANALDRRGHEVVIFCCDPTGVAVSCYQLNKRVTLHPFSVDANSPDCAQLRKALLDRNLDVLVAMFSWRDLLWFSIAVESTGIPLLISEHNHPEIINNERWNQLEREAAMSGADRIHVLLEQFPAMFPECLRDRIKQIPNPVPRVNLMADPVGGLSQERILMAVGRFDDSHKQFSILFKAFAIIRHKYPEWRLHLYGEGRDEGLYRKLVSKLGLGEVVRFMGVTDNINAEYAKAQLFCIPSRYEGFGLVTVEAHRHGIPAVGFAGCTGTNEIIINGLNGLLASEMTPESLGQALDTLMKYPELRRRLGQAAISTALRYDPEPIYDQWEALIAETAAQKGNTMLSRRVSADEYSVLRMNLQRIGDRERLFDPTSGAQLWGCNGQTNSSPDATNLFKQLKGAQQKLEKVIEQRDSAWNKISSLKEQRDSAWAKIKSLK